MTRAKRWQTRICCLGAMGATAVAMAAMPQAASAVAFCGWEVSAKSACSDQRNLSRPERVRAVGGTGGQMVCARLDRLNAGGGPFKVCRANQADATQGPTPDCAAKVSVGNDASVRQYVYGYYWISSDKPAYC